MQRADMKWIEALESLSFVDEQLHNMTANNLTEAVLLSVWSQFDRDNSGVIDAQELHQAMEKLGINLTPTQLQDVVARADVNRDGTVSFEEFESLIHAMYSRNSRRKRQNSKLGPKNT